MHRANNRRFINRPFLRSYGDIIRVQNEARQYEVDTPDTPLNKPAFQHRRKYGPIHNRSCTDLFCLLIFVIFLALWAWLIFYFMQYVNVQQTINPTDSYGHICGQGEYEDKPYLVFFSIFKCATDLESTIIDGCRTPQVCVSKCPDKTFSIRKTSSEALRKQELENAICWYDVKPNEENLYEYVHEGKCAQYYLNSEPIGGRCIPSLLKMINDDVQDELHNTSLTVNNHTITREQVMESNIAIANLMKAMAIVNKVANDIVKTWRWILVGLVITMLVAFTWIFLMQHMTRYMIWLSIISIFVLNIVALYYCANQYMALTQTEPQSQNITENSRIAMLTMVKLSREEISSSQALKYIRSTENDDELSFDFKGLVKEHLESYLKNSKVWMGLIIVLSVILLICTLLLFCLCRRITLAVAVIEEASNAVNSMKSTLAFPIVPFFLKMLVIAFAIVAFVIISSGSHPQYRDPNGQPCIPDSLDEEHIQHLHPNTLPQETINKEANTTLNCTFHRPFTRKIIYSAHAFNLFGFLWALFFMLGLCYVTLSGAFASYYWTLDKQDVPFFALLGSFYRCLRYHLGSVAFGSLLVAVVRFVRIIIEYIDNKCKKYADNVLARVIMCCCKCCFWCLENFIRFVNKNAYIMMAIYGKNFCASAKDAFLLLVSNGVRAVVLNCLTGFLLFLSKLAVTCLVGVAGFYVLTNRAPFLVIFHDLNYYWAPLVLFIILSYIVTSTFFNVYDVAVETIFLCYLEDCKVNDGSKERPYFMAKRLAKMPFPRPPPSPSTLKTSGKLSTISPTRDGAIRAKLSLRLPKSVASIFPNNRD